MDVRVALVSGANRGIGADIARHLYQQGWQLSLGMRTPSRPAWDDDGRCHLFAYDATEGQEPAWVQEAHARFGRIDALVPCAGLMIPKSVIDAEEDELEAMMAVNVMAPRRLAKAAWEPLKASGRGRILLPGSLSGKRVKSADSGTYALTKHATVALAHALRQAGWEHGIRATAINPGFVNTDMARSITHYPPDQMTDPTAIAEAVGLLINLPNTSSVAEFNVNCVLEPMY
ncbi:SDR family NAD(P)-dependent oxidoreductase [Larsenimonas rhizosphaerae]|uniref:SDR family NAD(P)-dependent oxidoreductase n=1 Tax=Larsenimonas rhizosphaerae TaxID=2944682 RepID=UPI002033B23A|nr:SDR family NAD(P)-dependent oxidoreductase [Larsenimonas rhizosphaerae]MCM2131244.1 SDR family NAD(P)-dependent oxidoreductase [Larsenimonas rhizosphaerae]